MDKNFWSEALRQFGIGIVFAVMLMVYYKSENAKWERNQDDGNKRWEQLFLKYSEDQKNSMETIRSCCMDQRSWSPK